MGLPNIRRLHMPSLGVMALVTGGILRLVASVFSWPLALVLVSQVVLLLAVTWIVFFDIFPVFLYPFYLIRRRFRRRYSFFFILMGLFAIMQLISIFLPSGHTRDTTVSLAFLSFLAGIVWIIIVSLFSAFTPYIKQWKVNPREAEKVTFSDIVTSMAIILMPTIILSFFFSPVGLSKTEVTPYQVFLTSFLTDIFILIYLYLYIIKPKVFTWRQLGIRNVAREHMGVAFVRFLLVVVVIAILHTLLTRLGLPLQRFSFSTQEGALFAFLVTVFLTPFVEELYFRGFLFKGLKLNHRPQIAYFISAGLFAVLHPPLIAMVEVFIIGILLAYLVKETKSLWPGMAVHMLNNAIVFGYLLYLNK
jgi:uncharacterized protein